MSTQDTAAFHNEFEIGFNFLISNNYSKASEHFQDRYYQYPDKAELLHGFVVSELLGNRHDVAADFLKREIEFSQHQPQIRVMLQFLINNKISPRFPMHEVLMNMGVFLQQNGFHREAAIYVRVCELLQPNDLNILTITAERAIKEKNYRKGVRLFHSAFQELKKQG